jgi:hypothetical protein
MQFSIARVALFTVFSAGALCGQSKDSTPAPPQAATAATALANRVPKPAPRKPPKPKLTAQQEEGLRLLKASEAEASGLEPAARTYILWKVSNGYRTVRPARADIVLRRAFTASRSIVEPTATDDCHVFPACHFQAWTQSAMLLEMMHGKDGKADPERIERFLPHANPDVKKELVGAIALAYLKKQNFDRVRQIMDQADDDAYSYELAGEFIAALPESRRAERLAVFSQALQNFRNRGLDSMDTDNRDFGVLIVRFWREMPPPMVLDAIDAVFERSNESDEVKKVRTINMNLMNGHSIPFESEYDFHLFQLLPVLREIDSSKAKDLLEEHDNARRALDQYPSGMQSVDPNYYGDKPIDQKVMPSVLEISSAADDQDATTSSAFQADRQIQARIFALQAEIEKDPEQAYQDAMNLPLHYLLPDTGCPRASALKRVALGIAEKNPTLARSAMDEARRLAQDLEPARQALLLAEVPDFYLKLGDEDRARAAIKDLMKLAEKIYAIDTDSDDPNLAFKGSWPSANAWRNCIAEATKLSPSFAEELLTQIVDPDIAGIERVMYASALVGAGRSEIAVFEWHKGGKQSGGFSMSQ